jgi:serine phosphatase RsbU (regulator of sigma subunit)/ligand-binding sensor domain-containing protein
MMKFSSMILFLFLAANIFSQNNLVFEHYSVQNGLPNPTVYDLIQDEYGFLWIGTGDGLCRYDGYEFKVYKNNPNDSTSLPSNTVLSIMEDNEGNLWIGGIGLFAKYVRKTGSFIPMNFDRGAITGTIQIWKLFEDSKNRIWFGTRSHGVYLFNKEKNIAELVSKGDAKTQLDWGWVPSIIESHDGKILATDSENGIFVYDEQDSVFNNYAPLSVPNFNFLFSLFEDEYNRFWLAGGSGVRMIDPATNKVNKINFFDSNKSEIKDSTTLRILSDQNGYLWFGCFTEGLYRYNPVTKESIHYKPNTNIMGSINGSQIISIYEDNFGILWVGTMNSGLNKVDPKKEPLNIYQLPSGIKENNINTDRITAVAVDETNNDVIWMGTGNLGLIKYDRGLNKFIQFKNKPGVLNSLSGNTVFSLTIGNDNNLWIGTDSSLCKLDTRTNVFTRYLTENIGLTYNSNINDIQIDATGRIYVATPHGVDLLIPGTDIHRMVPSLMTRQYRSELLSTMKSQLKENPIATIVEVGENQDLTKEFELKKSTKTLVVCGGEGQIDVSKTPFDYGWIENADGKKVWAMDDMYKTFYLGGGTKNRILAGCIELEAGKYKLRYNSDVGHSYGNWNVKAPDDSLLYGIQISELDDNKYRQLSNDIKDEISKKNYMPLESASSIFLSNKYENILWVGTTRSKLFRCNLKDNSYKEFLPDSIIDNSATNVVADILEDADGILWLATNKGLAEFNPSTEKFNIYTDKDGLPTNSISAIQEDSYGNIWVSSIAGLTKIVRTPGEKKYTFINIDIADGLQGYSFTNASWKTKDGELFFGGFNGVNSFYSGMLNQTSPDIVITDFKIGSQSITTASEDSPLTDDINAVKNITLNFGQNDFSFEFAAVHFSRPQRNKIAYKLDGINDDWVYDNRRFASFTNLSPGDYVFRLKGANGDGVWNEKEKIITITILPPWWRTTWAYILYGFVFVAGIFGIDRFQRRRLFKRAKETARMKETELRAQLAEAENARKSRELEEARSLQLSMLPKELPQLPNLDIAVYMKTATEVGGDYYDFQVGMDGTLTIVIGDATGHGLKAGTMVTATKSLFNTLGSNSDILLTFNEITRCIKQMQIHMLSMCLTMMKIQGNKMIMSAAGMPPALIYRKNTMAVEEVVLKGMPLGAVSDFPYQLRETNLDPGDTVLLLSDGLPELFDKNKEMFSYERVVQVFSKHAHKSPEEIIEGLKTAGSDWIEDAEPDDDVTFVVLKVKN